MFEKAQWIWNPSSKGCDAYAEFLTSCEFQSNDKVTLRISVDSNYAVYVNGQFVDSGQYADLPHYKVYDEINLSDYMKSGINHIAFTVWYYGISSDTYFINNHGLIFEIERNGDIVLSSDESVKSRKSKRYISGKQEKITNELGLNFHVNLKHSNEWMTGEDVQEFEASEVVEGMPEQLFPREIKKLILKPRVSWDVVSQGTFIYPDEVPHSGAKMQHAALTFFRIWDMGQEKPGEKPVILSRKTEEGVYFIVDLHTEVAGYLDFDIEVNEDCQMEVGWGEHLYDGRCRTSIGPRNFSVTVALQKGRNCYMNPFRRLGCRYLQFFLHTDTVKIQYAGIRPTEYPVKMKEYKSGNLLRDTVYSVSQNTLLQCMHEHYEDCPWREQSLYNLDSRNQMLCGYYAFGEYEFPRANLRLMSNSLKKNGTLPICFPTNDQMCIPSFTLFYIVQLAEYYRYSQDVETVKYCFHSARTILDTFIQKIDEAGLIPTLEASEGFWNFYEWQVGMDGWTYSGKSYDMCLNALLSLVIDYFVDLCIVVDVDTLSYLQVKAGLNTKIVEAFFDETDKLFRTTIDRDISYSVLANAWGYLCGAAKDVDKSNMIKIIQHNGADSLDMEVIPATLSMYTFRYDTLLKENYEHNKDVVLAEIDKTYFGMLRKGATSFWETMRGDEDFSCAGSLCHGWSAMPIYYYELLCG